MNVPSELPRQRAGREVAAKARDVAIEALQPLHDTLLEEAPQSFDGLVTFAIDRWHERNASAAATLQPPSDDSDRFAFYRQNIQGNRIDLAATAFGAAMDSNDATHLKSRMNPTHTTYAPRVVIDGRVTGGVQAAFNTAYGEPLSEAKLAQIWKKYMPVVEDVMHTFDTIASSKGIRSIGDTLELLAPTTPNAFVISWDMAGSTMLSKENYGALRNYLLDTKGIFNLLTSEFKGDYHDNGDGQDMIIWLPDGVDRADPLSVGLFGHKNVIPLLTKLQAAQAELVATDYTDINPSIRFAVGLANVEKNHFEGRTARELWEIDEVMDTESRAGVGYTKAARTVLNLALKTK